MGKNQAERIIDQQYTTKAVRNASGTASYTVINVLSHSDLNDLNVDDHLQYLLSTDAGGRTNFSTKWTDLTDGGDTTIHIHDSRYYTETELATASSANIHWTNVSKVGSNLNEIATRSHTVLSDIGTNTHSQIDSHIAASDIHVAHSTVSVLAGDGLTGGGTIAADRTLNVGVANTIQAGAGAGLSVEANAVRLTAGYDPGTNTSILASDSTGKLTLPLMVASTSLTTPLLTTASGDLTIDPAGVVKFPIAQTLKTADFNSDFPILGWQINENPAIAGQSALTIGAIAADELHVKIFVADETRVDRGDEYWTKSYGIVAETFVTPSAIGGTVTVVFEDSPALEGAIFSVNDWLLFRQVDIDTGFDLTTIWGQVSGYTDLPDGLQSWTFTLRSGDTLKEIKAGSLATDFGATNAGLIHLSTIDIAGAPYIKMRRWAGADPYTPANFTTYVQIGELASVSNASLPYAPSGYGLYVRSGTAAGRAILVDDNGLMIQGADFRLYDGTNNTMLLSAGAGNDSPVFAMGATLPTGALVNDGIWAGKDGSAYKWRVGTVSGGALVKGIYWDGTNLIWKATNTSLDASGNLVAGPVTLSSAGVTSAATNDYANNAAYKFTSSGIVTSGTFAYATPTDTSIWMSTNLWGGSSLVQDAARNAYTRVGAYAISTKDAAATFEAEARDAYGATVKLARILASANGAQSSLDFNADTVKANTYTIWHAGNDGHNSTLDADTLDTYHASSFALLSGPTFAGHVKIGTTNTYDIGEAGVKWRTLYVGNIVADTISGASMSGATWRNDASDMGIYSSAAGTRTLNIANDGAGVMNVAVDGSVTAGSFSTVGNITVSGTVDGVDISAFKSAYDSHNHDSRYYTETELQTSGSATVHWGNLSNKPTTFAPSAHALVGSDHTASGLTAGHVVRASGTTTFAWAQLAHGDLSDKGENTHATIDSHISATAAHGVSGAIVGTTDVQTLSNKTMGATTFTGLPTMQAHLFVAPSGTFANTAGWASVVDVYSTGSSRITARTGVITLDFTAHDTGWSGAPAGAHILTSTNYPLTFGTNNSPRMTITAGGNAVFGATDTTAKVEVVGSIYTNPSQTDTVFSGSVGAQTANFIGSDGYWALRTAVNNSFNLDVYNSGTPKAALTVLQNGNTGVNTPAPLHALHVSGQNISLNNYGFIGQMLSGEGTIFGHNVKADPSTSNQMLSSVTGYYGQAIRMYYNQGIAFHATDSTVTAGAVFDTVSTEKMRLTNAGRLGLKTPNPQSIFQIGTLAATRNTAITTYDQVYMGGLTLVANDGYDSYIANNIYLATDTWRAAYGSYGSGLFAMSNGILNYYNSPAVGNNAPVSLTARLTILENGRIGVKATSPRAQFHVAANASSDFPGASGWTNAAMLVSNADQLYGLYTGISGSGPAWMQVGRNDYVEYYDLDLQPNGGNLKVGTGTHSGKLSVRGSYSDVSLNYNSTVYASFGAYQHTQLAISSMGASPYTISIQAKHESINGSSYPIALNPLGGKVGVNRTDPVYTFDVTGTGRFTSTLYAGDDLDVYDTLTVGGATTLSGDLSVGTVFRVNKLGTRVGINRDADSQFDLDVAGPIRGTYLVGKHAIQLDNAVGVFHFDGAAPYNLDFTGSNASHMGVGGTVTGGVIHRPGKFGKAVQVAEATTNLVTNPRFETNTTGWSTQGTTAIARIPVFTAPYGGYAAVVDPQGAVGNGAEFVCTSTTSAGTQYTVSIYVYPLTVTTFRLWLYDEVSGGAYTDFSSLPVNQWTRITKTHTFGAGSTFRGLIIQNAASNDDFLIAAVQLEAKAYATPYCDGSLGTGHAWTGTAHASTSTRAAGYLNYPASTLPATVGTVMAWVNLGAPGSVSQVIAHSNGGTGFLRLIRDNVAPRVLVVSYGTISYSSTDTIADNTWTHIAIVSDGTTVTGYINGIAKVSGAVGTPLSGHTETWFGHSGGGYNANGLFDDFVILDYAAEADLIRTIYESDAPVFVASSVFHWRSPARVPIWVDEFGLWAQGVNGGAMLGLYGGDPRNPTGNVSKSWGGVTMYENDLVIGRTTSGGAAIHWDDSESKLRIGVQSAEHLALTSTALRMMNDTTEMLTLVDSTLTLGSSGGSTSNLYLDAGQILFRQGSTTLGSLTSSTWTLGQLATNYVKVTADSIEIGRNSVPAISLNSSGNASFTGAITANTGWIGGDTTGWQITAGVLSSFNIGLFSGAANVAHIRVGDGGAYSAGLNSGGASTDWLIWAGASHANRASAAFRVFADGYLYASNATISGAITATSGSFTGAIDANSGTLGSLTVDGTLTVGTGGKIVSGATDYASGTGIFLGLDDTTHKMRIGTTAGNRLTWDGTTLTIAGSGAGITAIDGGNITTGTVTATQLSFTPVTSTNVVASINATAEGIRISGNRISIDGDVTFSSGYDPTGKIASGGAAADVNANPTTISGGKITANSITASKLEATNLSGIFADLGSITAGSIVVGSTNKLWLNDAGDGKLAIGGTAKASAPFRVSAAGYLIANDAEITGNITAESGSITGALTMGASGTITATNTVLDGNGISVVASNSWDSIASYKFKNSANSVIGGVFGLKSSLNTQIAISANVSAPNSITPFEVGKNAIVEIESLSKGVGTTAVTSLSAGNYNDSYSEYQAAVISISSQAGTNVTTGIDMWADSFLFNSNTVWHAGNFTPGNYSLTSHNHSGVYAPASHTHAYGDISGNGNISTTGTAAITGLITATGGVNASAAYQRAGTAGYLFVPVYTGSLTDTDAHVWNGTQARAYDTTFIFDMQSSANGSVPAAAKAVVIAISANWATPNQNGFMVARKRGSSEYPLVCRGHASGINTDVVGIVPLDDTNHDIEIYVSNYAAPQATAARLIGYFI